MKKRGQQQWLYLLWQTSSRSIALAARCAKRGSCYRRRISQHESYVKFDELTLRIFLIGFSAFLLCKPSARISATKSNAFSAGGVAEFLAALIGTGGLLRDLTLAELEVRYSALLRFARVTRVSVTAELGSR